MGHHVVRLRLARWGQRHRPFYRIVATSSRRKRDGRYLEIVGAYNPLFHSQREKEARVKRVWLNVDRIRFWLASGAHPSETVARLLGTSGLLPISPRTVRKQLSEDENQTENQPSSSSSATPPPLSATSPHQQQQQRSFSTSAFLRPSSPGLRHLCLPTSHGPPGLMGMHIRTRFSSSS